MLICKTNLIYKKMKYLVAFFMLIAFTAFNQSDDKSDKILDRLSNEIKALKSFSMEFTMKVENKSTGENSTQKGKGLVKGDKYSATLGENEIISNGIKVWTIVKEEKVVYQSDADEEDEESINPKKLMTIWEEGFKSKYVKETTLDGKKVHQIDLFPTNPGEVQYHTITLFIGVSDADLSKAIMKTKDGSIMTYEISKFVENVEIPASKFVYDPRKNPGFQLIRD